MSVGTLTRRDPATVVGATTGVVVAAVLMACLLHPTMGQYIAEAVAMVSALGTAGAALFAAVAPGRVDVTHIVRGPVTRLALIAFAAALVTLPFAVMAVSGDGLRGLGDSLARAAALRSGDYEAVVARGTGLVLVVGGLRVRPGRGSRVALTAGAVLVIGSFLLMGHVRTHHPMWAVFITVFAHVGAAAAWFGGLLALGLALRRVRGDAAAAGQLLAAFARVMTAVLAVLVAAGVGLAVLFLPSPAALVRTVYGDVLLIKLAVIGGIVVYSSANHLRLVPAAKNGDIGAVRALRANVVAEQILLVAVLLITEVLMRQNPGG